MDTQKLKQALETAITEMEEITGKGINADTRIQAAQTLNKTISTWMELSNPTNQQWLKTEK